MEEEIKEKVKFKQIVGPNFYEMLMILTKISIPMEKSMKVSRFLDSFNKEMEIYSHKIQEINADFSDERAEAEEDPIKMAKLNHKLNEKIQELQECESEIMSIDFNYYKDHPKFKEPAPLLLHMLKPIFCNFPKDD